MNEREGSPSRWHTATVWGSNKDGFGAYSLGAAHRVLKDGGVPLLGRKLTFGERRPPTHTRRVPKTDSNGRGVKLLVAEPIFGNR